MQDTPTIMVVDDEESNVRLLESFLIPRGYNVVKTYSGEEALRLLEEAAIDLVFLDIIMPGMSGFDVLREIKESEKNRFVPVVLLTGLASKEHRIKGLEMGADDFMSKPFDATALLARTRSLLRIKSLHDRLQQSYEDLKRVEESKELMTHMIVHDLRSPLMVIHSSLELMSLEMEDHFSPDDIIAPRNIMRSCKRMAGLINNILDICKLEDGRLKLEYESIDISKLFYELINEYEGETLAKKAKMYSRVEDNVREIKADIDIIIRVLENLISNAFKSIRDNGEVWLNAVFDEVAGSVRICVSDNGYGIPPEYLTKVFDKYEQVEMKKKGIVHHTGLGLTFCKMAVEAHGGHIWVESEPEKGSAFTFTLPVSGQ
ncbi:MAG: hybrid sensor histidine kinase/response regulator [Pseudomonadota bacterium]